MLSKSVYASPLCLHWRRSGGEVMNTECAQLCSGAFFILLLLPRFLANRVLGQARLAPSSFSSGRNCVITHCYF